MIGPMAAQIRTSTFLDAVNHWATATTRLPACESKGNKINPWKVRIAGRADLQCGLGTALFLVSLVGCNLTSGCEPGLATSGHGTTKPTHTHPTTNHPHFTNAAPLRPTAQGDHFKRLFERRSGFQDAYRVTRFLPRALEAARQPGRHLEPP